MKNIQIKNKFQRLYWQIHIRKNPIQKRAKFSNFNLNTLNRLYENDYKEFNKVKELDKE